MAKILATVPLTAPASSTALAVDATFTMSENYTLSGSGASPTVTLYWQYDQGTGTWVDIPTTGTTGLVASAGSQASAVATTVYSRTITCKSAGAYVIRARGISSTPTTVDSANQPTTTVNRGVDNLFWTLRTLPSTVNWRSITYGNGIFVAVAHNSNVAATSPDGITWTLRTLPSVAEWTCVVYGNGVFVAVSGLQYSSRTAATSPDGITWTARILPIFGHGWSIAYGNGVFVAVPNEYYSVTSPDGITWTAYAWMPVEAQNRSVIFGNGMFVAVGSGSSAMVSSNGISWAYSFLPSFSQWWSVAYGNGMFVAMVYNSDSAASSPDCSTWTARTLPSVASWQSVVYGNGGFVALAAGGSIIATSPDGITWTLRTLPFIAYAWRSVAYGNETFVAVAWNSNKAVSSSYTPPAACSIETIAYLFTPPETYDENPDTIDFNPSESPIIVDVGTDQIITFALGAGYPPASYYIAKAWITNVDTSEKEQVLPLPEGTYTFVDVQHDWIFEVDVAHTFLTVKSFPWVGKFRMCRVP